jgi:glycosyltransferase involved in cell wall biosynthesis
VSLDIEPGYVLCVSRLLPYKNVSAVAEAFRSLSSERLVIVGAGPQEPWLRSTAASNVRLVGGIGDSELRWLYRNARALVAASNEDFGLTPLEAAAFGKPVAALRWGGFLDTIAEGTTGLFFNEPSPREIATTVRDVLARHWDAAALKLHASLFAEDRFIARIREVVREAAEGAVLSEPRIMRRGALVEPPAGRMIGRLTDSR